MGKTHTKARAGRLAKIKKGGLSRPPSILPRLSYSESRGTVSGTSGFNRHHQCSPQRVYQPVRDPSQACKESSWPK